MDGEQFDEAVRAVPTRLEKVLLKLRELEKSEQAAHLELDRVKIVHTELIVSVQRRLEGEVQRLSDEVKEQRARAVDAEADNADLLSENADLKKRAKSHFQKKDDGHDADARIAQLEEELLEAERTGSAAMAELEAVQKVSERRMVMLVMLVILVRW